MDRLRVLLIAPPLAEPAVPNLAIELLANAARRAGHDVRTLHAALFQPPVLKDGLIHGLIGPIAFVSSYYDLPPGLVVEEAADAAVADATRAENRSWEARENTADLLLHAVEEAERCLAAIVERIPPNRYDVIGFSIGFDAQKLPGATIARALRRRGETGVFVAGGTGCDGPMGPALLEQFPEFDVVMQGEADSSWVHLLERLATGDVPDDTPGVVRRVGDSIVTTAEAPVDTAFVGLEPVDYSSFLSDRRESPHHDCPLIVLFESSRGCWWGRRRHCTFCGIRSVDEEYRVRPAAATIERVVSLWDTYEPSLIYSTDAIAPDEYDADVWPALAEHHETRPWAIFYESKSNVGRAGIARFAAAGVSHLQPGIESLSSHVLRLMRKGATALQQVAFLKWSQAYGIVLHWGLLVGTPGETSEDLLGMVELIDRIPHLPPPVAINPLALHRFSPHFDDPASFGIEDVRPFALQRVIYRADDERLLRLCYHLTFTARTQETPAVTAAADSLRAAVARWELRHSGGARLTSQAIGDARLLAIADERGPRLDLVSDPVQVYVLDASADVVPLARLQRDAPFPAEDIRHAVEHLEEARLVVVADACVLALPIPMDADARADAKASRGRDGRQTRRLPIVEAT